MRRPFSFGEVKLEMVREYKYLGYLVTPSFNITTALIDLKNRGLRAYGALKAKLGITFRKHLPTTFYLFDSLVKPILTYASDFWGTLKLCENNPVEIFHRKFCKQLLGVHIQTTNVAVLLELGRLPLEVFAKKNASKNWDRISSVESKTALCPRQRLGVFNAQPSRHVRSQDDLVCSRGSSVTWDPQVDT